MPSPLQLFGASAVTAFAFNHFTPQYSLGIFFNAAILFLTLSLLNQTWTVFIYPRFFSPLRHLPSPPGHWFWGHWPIIQKESAGKPQRDWMETVPNDGLIRYNHFFQDRVLLTNPKTLGEVLVTKNYEFIKPASFRQGLARILGVGILLAEGDEHKRQRKLLMPAFSYRHIKDLYPVFWDKGREMTDCVLEASKETSSNGDIKASSGDPEKASTDEVKHAPGAVNVGNWTSRTTLDIIGLSGMGQDFNSLKDPNNKLNQTYQLIFNPGRVGRILQLLNIFLPLWIVRAIPVKRNSDMSEASVYIKQVCRDLIANKRKMMAEKERTEVDIISVALESGGFTDEELVNQTMTFLVAGHETTATSMIWALYLLCANPAVQTRLRNEIRSKLPSLSSPINAAQLDECHYLHAVCTETLRLWSPVSLTMRTAEHDATINNQFIPAGTMIIISPYATNTSTSLWGKDALEFRPERWLDENGKANNKGGADSNYAFETFLHGPRSCIGQRFAMAEFECLLAAWVGRFETQFEEGSKLARGELEVKGGITSKPAGGLWVKVKELEGW